MLIYNDLHSLNKYKVVSLAILTLGLSLAGCGSVSVADNQTENTDVAVIQDDFSEIEADDNAGVEEEIIVDGDKFYDLPACENIQLSDSCMMQPILQNPDSNSVLVCWFTETEGEKNQVVLYEDPNMNGATRSIDASTTVLSRVRGGKSENEAYNPVIKCEIYKHTAIVDGLPLYHGNLSERVNYRVETDDMVSEMYSLSAIPQPGTPLKILLTSDHQTKNMVAANISKVYETVGNVDAILFNGDMVDVADSGYNWFYADNAMFRVMTGTANDNIGGVDYNGAPFLQQAPIYTSIGNHDVMGVYSDTMPLNDQFNNPKPVAEAERQWDELLAEGRVNPDDYDMFIQNNSFNTITYEEIFNLPESATGKERYYATSFGDIRLISLEVARVWRLSNIGVAGKYSEIPGVSQNRYGYGDFIFESVDEDSDQIRFLKAELNDDKYKNAKYKMVMFHSEAHSLGNNQVPAFCDPISQSLTSPVTGQDMVIYNYPIENDYIINVIEPLLEAANTDLLFEAHSHIWNRFVTGSGMNVLETSNVGNTYGAYTAKNELVRSDCIPFAYRDSDPYHGVVDLWNRDYYLRGGDPNGLAPVVSDTNSTPDKEPYISSNTITVFSILDTKKGTVDSYYFDTDNPDSEVVMFDSFPLE